MIDDRRPAPYPADNEMMGETHDGEAPRPATEPHGSEGSSNSGETATDPSTGEPNDDQVDRDRQDPEKMDDAGEAQEEAARQREEEGGYQ